MTKIINTILVEDHEITRLGLRKMLEYIPAVKIVAEVACGKMAVSKAKELKPDLILMDIGLPNMDGIEATRVLKESDSVKIVVITSHDNDEDVFAALRAGADAYCLKGISKRQLANCISSVLEGAIWLDPGIASKILSCMSQPSRNKPNAKASATCYQLSEREIEVLTLLVEGHTNHQMAEKLFLSAETIKTHMRHVMEKLQVSDRTQAAIKAVTEGLVPEIRLRQCG